MIMWLIECRRHVKTFHRLKDDDFRCDRCGESFPTKDDLKTHARQEEPCQVGNVAGDHVVDPEDGATTNAIKALIGRKEADKKNSWITIWKVLFPDDEYIPRQGLLDFIDLSLATHPLSQSYRI